MTSLSVDINCDAGESFGPFRIGDDEAVMASATSVNIACGFHGGDPRTMEATTQRAKELGMGVGAHPGFPDLVGFGRRDMALSAEEVRTDTLYQIGALAALAQANGVQLQHVKPHGQLNNMAFTDPGYARAIVEAVAGFDAGLILIAYGGELVEAARAAGLHVAHEVYADRAYHADGSLIARSQPGAVIHEVKRVAERAVAMVRNSDIIAITGERLPVRVDTICIHSDTPAAGAIARAVREALEAAGITRCPLGQILANA